MRVCCPNCGRGGSLPDGQRLPAVVRCPACKTTFPPRALPEAETALEVFPDLEPPRVFGVVARHEPPAAVVRPTPAPEPVALRECDYCGESILPAARKCKHCGEFLDPALRKAEEKRLASPPPVVPSVVIHNTAAASASAASKATAKQPGGCCLLIVLCGLGLCLLALL